MKRFALLLYIASVTLSFAQTSGKKTSLAKIQVATQAFSMGANRLPPHFTGNNASAIYDAFKKSILSPNKSEFETRSEYEARQIELSDKPFFGGLKASDHFAFVLGQAWSGTPPTSEFGESEGSLYGYVALKYDADAKELAVRIPTEALADSDGKFYRWVSLWRRKQIHLGSYVGQNAFGVKKTVNRLGVEDVDLIIEDANWLDFDCTHEIDSESCSIALSPTQARVLVTTARVVVVGSLVAPYLSSQSNVSDPSVDQPSELHHSYRLLHVKLDELLVVDSQSGKIIKKYSRKKHSEEFPLNVEFRVRKDESFSDPRCAKFAHSHPLSLIEVNYSADGAEEQNETLLKGSLLVTARQFVDVKLAYCNAERVEVFLNGQQHEMTCERQEQYIANRSKCNRIELAP